MVEPRKIHPPTDQDVAVERKKTPIRTFSPDYAHNPDRRWIVERVNMILTRADKREESLSQIRSAIYEYFVKVDNSKDTLEQLVPLLGAEGSRPELRDIWEVRAAAALMLGGTRSKDAVPALVSAFENEENLNVKEAICLALGVIGVEGLPLRRLSEALAMELEAIRWQGPEKKSEYMNFLKKSFYEAPFQPPVLFENWQEEFLTQSLSGRQQGADGPANWQMRASAALLLGASGSFNVLPNLISSAAKDVHQVRDCSKMAAVRIGRNYSWHTDVRSTLSEFIGPAPGERHAKGRSQEIEKMAVVAKEILVLVSEIELHKPPVASDPSDTARDLLESRQNFIGTLRMARESGDYNSLAREFPVETVVRNMVDPEYVRTDKEHHGELKSMFSNYIRAAARNPEAYAQVLGALIDVAVEELMEARDESETHAATGPTIPMKNVSTSLSADEAKFLKLLGESYYKGDYSGLVKSVKMEDATRMLIRSASAKLEPRHLPFLKRLTAEVIQAGIRARGPKAFFEAAETLYEMALTSDLYLHCLSQAVVDMISTPKKRIR